MIEKLKQIYHWTLAKDWRTWISHFLLCLLPSFLVYWFIGPRAAVGAAFLLSLYFVYRETFQYYENKKLKDCIFDTLGPIINVVIWFYVLVA